MLKAHSVFKISLTLSIVFVVVGVLFYDWLGEQASSFLDFAVVNFNWFYLLVGSILVSLCIYLMFSKYGNIRLGKDTERPEYSTFSWITMLFAAGMGVGLVFWSVAEPVGHYTTPPYGEGSTSEAANVSLQYTFFHWGLHPWAIFGVIALGLAYFSYRKGLPTTISSIFYPVLGDKVYSVPGKTIDILAVFVTAVGVASTFGLSALQISGGLNYQFGTPNTFTTQLIIIGIATALFIISSWSGISRGIKYLSHFNMLLLFLVMALVIIVGPGKQIFEMLISTTGSYIGNIVPMSLRLEAFNDEASNWIGNWTVFYWAWWTTWAPFVGAFIARISRGRTIRQFVAAVLLIPSLVSFVWFSVIGGSALHLIHNLGLTGLASNINADVESALFVFFGNMPLGFLLSVLAIVLIFTFLITSADSATFVLGMLSNNGDLHPSTLVKVTWGVITAGAATVFILAGGVDAVRTISIVIASPFTIIMLFICFVLFREVRKELKVSGTQS
ncbi:BCCT family transporter [Salicibibacter cibarius]|uniref:BCCT family transporter n=1 Tax=Salicibibacter cibarius TaxID=2743000 RepID=UPI001FED09A4|nr:BCCT family transporter [Salicibibacter cibarius]